MIQTKNCRIQGRQTWENDVLYCPVECNEEEEVEVTSDAELDNSSR